MAEHGSPAAVRRHYRRKEPLCLSCQQAQTRVNEDKWQRHLEEREEFRELSEDEMLAVHMHLLFPGITQRELAEAIGWHKTKVHRVLRQWRVNDKLMESEPDRRAGLAR